MQAPALSLKRGGPACAAGLRLPESSGEGEVCWAGSRLAHQVDMLSAILEMLVPALVAESRMLCSSPQAPSESCHNKQDAPHLK